jgi:hypothetical protein
MRQTVRLVSVLGIFLGVRQTVRLVTVLGMRCSKRQTYKCTLHRKTKIEMQYATFLAEVSTPCYHVSGSSWL